MFDSRDSKNSQDSYEIEKVVTLHAPVSRVWRALTDHEQFGKWFRVKLDQPFEPGALSTGRMTYPGYEHYKWRAMIERIEPESYFSMRWHHLDEDNGLDASEQPTTLVEFRLEPATEGTQLTITESGFATFPEPRRIEAMRRNTRGWNIQAENIAAYVTE